MASSDDSTATPKFRLLRGGAEEREASEAASYTNRHGVTYYLHETVGKDGRNCLVLRKEVGDGALRTMPDDYDFSESLGGRVSVRRVRGDYATVPVEDLELVRSMLAWYPRLEECVALRSDASIMIHEPDPDLFEDAWWKWKRDPENSLAFHLGSSPALRAAFKFEIVESESVADDRVYEAVGPQWPGDLKWEKFERGPLPDLIVRWVPKLGRPIEP